MYSAVVKKQIKTLVPKWFLKFYREVQRKRFVSRLNKIRRVQAERDSLRTAREVFSEIYKRNLWGGRHGEFYSGHGSRFAPAEQYVSVVLDFIKRNDISSVVDLGCGDFEIGEKIASACSTYVGIDIVPELIARNRATYQNNRVQFECLDITEDPLPDAQLCLIRQVLQHLSNQQIAKILVQVKKYKYLIVTEHFPNTVTTINKDKVHGSWTRVEENSAVFLEHPPFNAAAIELLLEVRPVALNQEGKLEEYSDSGVLRSFRVQL